MNVNIFVNKYTVMYEANSAFPQDINVDIIPNIIEDIIKIEVR